VDRPEKIIKFIETLRLPDGTMAGNPVVLRDWQKRIIREVYGPSDQQGRRAVKQAVLSMGRKNGKTALVSFLTLCHLCGPAAVRNGQLYSLSIDREQAGILFNYAINIIYMDEELEKRLNVVESRKQIHDPISGSTYFVLSGEKKGKMGKSSSFIAFDELAEFGGDRSLYDALLTSTGAHDEPMIWVFSTQAYEDTAVMSELVDYGKKVSRGEVQDDTFKSFIYEVPKDLDVFKEENWYLANPALNDFRNLKELQDFAEKAKLIPTMENTLRWLYANQRVDHQESFITKSVWEMCSCGVLPISDQSVWCGLDLSSHLDLTALVVMFDSDGVWQVHPFFWTPEDGLRERVKRDRVPYDVWVKEGLIETTPGKTVGFEFVVSRMADILSVCLEVNGIGFDRWKIDYFKKEMDRYGVEFPMFPHGQGYKDQTLALSLIESAFLNIKVAHGDNPVLRMCVANAVVLKDPAGNRKLDKAKSTGRIDGLAALANAFGVMALQTLEEPFRSRYEDGAAVITL